MKYNIFILCFFFTVVIYVSQGAGVSFADAFEACRNKNMRKGVESRSLLGGSKYECF